MIMTMIDRSLLTTSTLDDFLNGIIENAAGKLIKEAVEQIVNPNINARKRGTADFDEMDCDKDHGACKRRRSVGSLAIHNDFPISNLYDVPIKVQKPVKIVKKYRSVKSTSGSKRPANNVAPPDLGLSQHLNIVIEQFQTEKA